ncbi:MBL fold metallo-hydrolase [Sphingomonas sp.]|uniref:MBL fold metallo-hydrolase n=1 Tax=Sphingomonas sp. TaxID=28214 RepID=UPI003AFFF870
MKEAPRYGAVEQVHPLVRRVLARNPSPFTFTGTHTHIVGRGEVAVIDPGPDLLEHLDAMTAALAGERLSAILVTHTHRDHSPLAVALAERTGAPVIGCAVVASPAFDESYAPDRVLADGESVVGEGWTLTAVATPGHTSNHLAFALPEARALFSGDHVMGWSTSVVVPPDGDMGAYLASLEQLLNRDEDVYFPTHGDPVREPRRLVRGMIGHRRQRERQVLRVLVAGPATIPAMVATMYAGLDEGLKQAAVASVHAHLIDLARRGAVTADGDHWRLAA